MTDRRVLSDIHPSGALLLWQDDSPSTAKEVRAWRDEGLTVVTVRGRKMRTLDALYDETAAALQFPTYFGENWPAFDECLSEMDWLSARVGLVILVSDPGEVLVDAAAAELGVLVRTIARAAATYAQPIDLGEWWDRPPVPFHVVLSAPSDQSEATRRRWGEAGAAIIDLTLRP